MNNDGSSTVNFLKGFIVGGMIGSMVCLLYAPMSGRKMRRRIVRRTNRVIDNVNAVIEDGKEKTSEMVKEANEYFRGSKKKAESVINEAKKIIS